MRNPVERCLACEADHEQGGKVRQTHAVSALYVATWFEPSVRWREWIDPFHTKERRET